MPQLVPLSLHQVLYKTDVKEIGLSTSSFLGKRMTRAART